MNTFRVLSLDEVEEKKASLPVWLVNLSLSPWYNKRGASKDDAFSSNLKT